MTHGAVSARVTVELAAARVATDTEWLFGEAFRAGRIGQSIDRTVALRTANFAHQVPQVRVAQVRSCGSPQGIQMTGFAAGVFGERRGSQFTVIERVAPVAYGACGTKPILSAGTPHRLGMAFDADHFCLFGVQTMGCADMRTVRWHDDGVRPQVLHAGRHAG